MWWCQSINGGAILFSASGFMPSQSTTQNPESFSLVQVSFIMLKKIRRRHKKIALDAGLCLKAVSETNTLSKMKKDNHGKLKMNESNNNKLDVDAKVSEIMKEVSDDLNFKLSPSLLDCPVCSMSLRSLVFQCANGHTTCPGCRRRQEDVCSVCKLRSNIRCRALESIISSLKVPCIYASYGCIEFVSYIQKDAHEDSCSSAPCSCPFFYCTFECLAYQFDEMITHIDLNHAPSSSHIEYDCYFYCILYPDDPYHVLYGNDNTIFLLIQDAEISHGNSLSVVCLQPTSVYCRYQYELEVEVDEYESLRHTAMALKMKKWEAKYPKRFLYIPEEVVFSMEEGIGVNVCIRKIDE